MSNKHPSAYPKNPGLDQDSTIPATDRGFFKAIFNAKTKAEEEYHRSMIEKPKITLFPWQVSILEEQFPESTKIHDWLSANFDVQIQQGPNVQDIQAKIYADLREAQSERMNTYYKFAQGRGKTWLGSQIEREREWFQRSSGVAEVPKVPGVRGVGYRRDKVLFDEPCHPVFHHTRFTDWEPSEEGNAALEEWLQRRSICYRAPSCSVA